MDRMGEKYGGGDGSPAFNAHDDEEVLRDQALADAEKDRDAEAAADPATRTPSRPVED